MSRVVIEIVDLPGTPELGADTENIKSQITK